MCDKISIIVPIYNSEKYLNECIESLVNQTYENTEILLIDDGSLDNSLNICRNYEKQDSRIKVFHKENGGASSARNIGLKNATGDYISFVDSDDYIEINMIEEMYRLLKKHRAQMCISKIDKRKQKKEEKILTQEDLLDNFFRIHGEEDTHSVCGRLIHRDLLGNYQFIEGKMNEDVETTYFLAKSCNKAIKIEKNYYNYRKNLSGVTNSRFTLKKTDLLYIWDIIYKDVNKNFPQYEYYCNMNYKRAYFTLLSRMVIDGYDKNNIELSNLYKTLKKSVRKDFLLLLKWKMPVSRKILLILMIL